MNGNRGFDLCTVEMILLQFESLSSEWLMRGKGNMLLSEETLNDNNSNFNEEIEALKAELNMMKGENRVLREQLGLTSASSRSKSA